MMVLIWFLASFPRPPEGATGPGDRLQLRRHDRPRHRAAARAGRLQLADRRGADPRHGGARGRGGRARHRLRHRGRRGGGQQIGQALATNWSLATALALLAWYVFAPQCASTLAVIQRETGGWKWMWVTFGYMLALAYRRGVRSPTRSPSRSAPAEARLRRFGAGSRRLDPDQIQSAEVALASPECRPPYTPSPPPRLCARCCGTYAACCLARFRWR